MNQPAVGLTDEQVEEVKGKFRNPAGDDLSVGEIHGKSAKIIAECIESGEPVFVLRAKDIFSVMGIAKYHEITSAYGPMDYEFEESIVTQLNVFREWQRANPSKVRYPD